METLIKWTAELRELWKNDWIVLSKQRVFGKILEPTNMEEAAQFFASSHILSV